MIRTIARGAALLAVAIDLAGAVQAWRGGGGIPLMRAALATGIAMVPCALAFLAVLVRAGGHGYRPMPLRLPVRLPRAHVGVAVLGGIAALAAMGEGFGRYVFLAGVALIALALSQARPRRRTDTGAASRRSVPKA